MIAATPAGLVMGRVIGAVVLRETRTRFGISRLGYLWALFEPMMHTAALVAVFTALGRGAPVGDNLTLFLVTGVTPWLLFNHVCDRSMQAVNANRALLTYPHVMPLDLIVARVILESATMLVVFALLCAGCALAFGGYAIERPLAVFAALASLAIIGAGLGMLFSAATLVCPTLERLLPTIRRPLFFVSGIFFVADRLPPQAREWLAYNPLLHAIEWLRSAFFVDFESGFSAPLFPVAFGCCALCLGLAAERLTRGRIKP